MADNKTQLKEELTKNVPSPDIVNEYVDLINQEMKAIKTTWEPFQHGKAAKNPLITNHMMVTCGKYEQLLKIAAMMKNPEMLSKFIDGLTDDPSVAKMVDEFKKVSHDDHDHHHH